VRDREITYPALSGPIRAALLPGNARHLLARALVQAQNVIFVSDRWRLATAVVNIAGTSNFVRRALQSTRRGSIRTILGEGASDGAA
jgi:hypothetical protein